MIPEAVQACTGLYQNTPQQLCKHFQYYVAAVISKYDALMQNTAMLSSEYWLVELQLYRMSQKCTWWYSMSHNHAGCWRKPRQAAERKLKLLWIALLSDRSYYVRHWSERTSLPLARTIASSKHSHSDQVGPCDTAFSTTQECYFPSHQPMHSSETKEIYTVRPTKTMIQSSQDSNGVWAGSHHQRCRPFRASWRNRKLQLRGQSHVFQETGAEFKRKRIPPRSLPGCGHVRGSLREGVTPSPDKVLTLHPNPKTLNPKP